MKYLIYQVFDSPTGEYFTIGGLNLCSVGEANLLASSREDAKTEFRETCASLRECGFSGEFALIETASNRYEGEVLEVG